MKEFVGIYDFNDISGLMWNKLAEMLIGRSDSKSEENGITFSVEEKKLLSGIINYILNKSSINDIDVASSSFMNNKRLFSKNSRSVFFFFFFFFFLMKLNCKHHNF